jgi:TusA-related sulfurtransferase
METPAIQLDARGLEPPQPMMKILEAVATLPAGATIIAHTDRQPLLLYPLLEQRGFTYETTTQSDGSHVTQIRYR